MFNVPQAGAAAPTDRVSYSSAHVFRPAWRDGAIPPAIAAALAIILAIALIVRGIARGISFASFAGDVIALVLLGLAGLLLYWAFAIYNLRYVVDDECLIIIWGWTRHVVPVDQIERIVLGRRLGRPVVSGLSWHGYHVGRGRVERFGEVHFFSAHRNQGDLVYLVSPSATFGFSLADARGLARMIQSAQEHHGAAQGVGGALYQLRPAQSLLGDTRALALAGCAFLAFLLAAGYIATRYQSLPLHLTFSYPPSYGPPSVRDRGELLKMPLTALLWLALGCGIAVWSHTRIRTVSYVILLGTLFAECLYAVAALATAH